MSAVALSVVNILAGTLNQITIAGTLNDPIASITPNPIIPGTGSITIPSGNTGQRVAHIGAMRLNLTTGFFEVSIDGIAWVNLAVGGGGAGVVLPTTANHITRFVDAAGTIANTALTTNAGGTDLTAPGLISAPNITVLTGGRLSLNNPADTFGIGFITPAIIANQTYTLWATIPSANNQITMSSTAGVMSWSTATYPPTTTINQLLYSSAANTIVGLATANNGLLVTSNAGVPSILAGPGTTGNILQSNAAAPPSFSTATYPSSTNINRILYSSANNVVNELATANSASLVTTVGGVPVWSGSLANGQIIIGSTGGTPAAASLTAGAGITITPGANTITIAAPAAGSGALVFIASQTAAANATLDFAACFSATYNQYLVTFMRVVPVNDGVALQMQLGTGGGPTWIVANYSWNSANTSLVSTNNPSDSVVDLTGTNGTYLVSNTAGNGVSGSMYISGTNGAVGVASVNYNVTSKQVATSFVQGVFGGGTQPADTFTSLRILFSAGNISTGTVAIYGIKPS